MAKQNVVAIVVLVSYVLALMCGLGESSTQDCIRNIEEANLLAHDAIALSIEETKQITRFVSRLVKLKSLQLSENASGLGYCASGVADNLNDLKHTLYKLKHLKTAPTLIATSPPLKGTINSAMSSVEACRVSIGDVDSTFADILTRKLNDLSFMVDDVEFRVSQLSVDGNVAAPTNP